MKKSAKGARVTVEYPDGTIVTYDGDRGDQIIMSVSKSGEETAQNIAYCNGNFLANAIMAHLNQNHLIARAIVREFIAADLPRMLREKGVEMEEDANELTLDRLLAKREEPGSGRTH